MDTSDMSSTLDAIHSSIHDVQTTFMFRMSCTEKEFKELDTSDFRTGDVICVSDSGNPYPTYKTYVWTGEWIELGNVDDTEEQEDDLTGRELASNCKNCGAPLYIDISTTSNRKISSTAKCKYCGTVQSIWRLSKEET